MSVYACSIIPIDSWIAVGCREQHRCKFLISCSVENGGVITAIQVYYSVCRAVYIFATYVQARPVLAWFLGTKNTFSFFDVELIVSIVTVTLSPYPLR